MGDRYQPWELDVFEALADESLAQMQEKTWVKYPDRFREKVISDLQREMHEHPKERSSLMSHARRLEIGPGRIPHPPRLADLHLDDHEPAPPEVAEAYMREIMDRLRPSPLAMALERTKERT